MFYTSAQGNIEAHDCLFTNNFGFQGGVLYQESEGQALFSSCTLIGNSAIQSSLVYSINSDSPIVFEGGLITANGATYDKTVQCFSNSSYLDPRLLRKFSLSFIQQVWSLATPSLVNTLVGNFQFQIVKATVSFTGGLRIVNQDQLLRVSSASVVTADSLIIQDTTSNSSLITSESSIIEITDILISNVTF